MYIDFEALPATARVWYYQADRFLSEEEVSKTEVYLKNEIEEWATHGKPMRGSFKIIYSRVLVLAADTDFQDPSGCSIDSSTRWLKELETRLGVSFFDRSIGYFEGDSPKFFSFFEAKKMVVSETILPDTPIINHQISTKQDLEDKLVVSAQNSFLKRYFSLVEE